MMRNTVYLATAMQGLLDACRTLLLTEDNTGCDASLTVVASDPVGRIRAELDALNTAERTLTVGLHEHRHGVGRYVFAAPVGATVTGEWFTEFLDDSFDPAAEEFATVEVVDILHDVELGVTASSGATSRESTPTAALERELGARRTQHVSRDVGDRCRSR